MDNKYILAIDQGTSATKAVIFNQNGKIVSKAIVPIQSYYPQAGFVEQDPLEIYDSMLEAIRQSLQKLSDQEVGKILTTGISNQRETFVLWDKHGEPLYNAVVWQCKRSVDICRRLQDTELNNKVIQRTGLIIDPYFSASKLIWLYENNKEIQDAIKNGKAFFGTIDSWLLFKLTDGNNYFTDYTNASRTLMFNIDDLAWDKELIESFGLAGINLAEAKPSSYNFGESDFSGLFKDKKPITSLIGDSHAAAFGEGCFEQGTAKATLGTGSSILMNTGNKRVESSNGMMRTICWSIQDRVDYALEGVIVSCGATIKWLETQIALFVNAKETEAMAQSVDNNNGVYLIPAFSGLGAPHWKMDARAAIMGLTFGSNKNHIVRAALESIVYQIKDVVTAMENDSAISLTDLMVDGGISSNGFVMQFLADLLQIKISNIGMEEVSALGAAYMAGLQAGIFVDLQHLSQLSVVKNQIRPSKQTKEKENSYLQWLSYIKQLST